ncbi:MAG: hypothetical protein IJ903_03075 [Ruminococcus sp.]|nr:hypothetical protein [Ruminococcus sp.]
MKEKYLSPTISVEVLERADILLASAEGGQTSVLKEKENAYGNFLDFVIQESLSWFN